MKLKSLTLFLLLTLTLQSCGDSNNTSALLNGDATILAFGDSLTYGTGAAQGEDYPSRLAELTGFKIINAGIPGEVSSQGLQRLPELLDEHKPNMVILIHGGNDILRKLPRHTLKENLLEMIELAKRRNIKVVLFGVPEPGLFLKSAEVYAQIENETLIPTELTLLPEILGKKSLKSDIAHPNAKGYQQMAKGILEFLESERFL